MMNTTLVERCKPEYRNLLAAVLKSDPSARVMFRHLRKLGAKNMRPDRMYTGESICKCGCGNKIQEQSPNPEVWYADCRGGLFVAMVRRGENDWDLND